MQRTVVTGPKHEKSALLGKSKAGVPATVASATPDVQTGFTLVTDVETGDDTIPVEAEPEVLSQEFITPEPLLVESHLEKMLKEQFMAYQQVLEDRSKENSDALKTQLRKKMVALCKKEHIVPHDSHVERLVGSALVDSLIEQTFDELNRELEEESCKVNSLQDQVSELTNLTRASPTSI